MLKYQDLQGRYGDIVALSLLMELERHVSFNSAELAAVDPEVRLEKVFAYMNTATVVDAMAA